MSGLERSILEQVDARADAPAFEFGNDVLSYADLYEQAKALAGQFQSLGVKRGDRVGIYMSKGLEMPVAVYGAFFANAAYVPLDPASPPERLRQLIDECGIGVIASAERMAPQLAKLAELGIDVAVIGAKVDGLKCHDRLAQSEFTPKPNSPDDLAYIIFTSGSTGTPKGIVHTHASGRAYAEMSGRLYPMTPEDRVGNYVPLHFDISTYDFLYVPMTGACTVMLPELVTKMPAMLSDALEKKRISVFYTVPFALIGLEERGALDKRDLSALRLVIFGGEPMPPKQLAALMTRFPDVRFSNSYGPAETNQISELTVESDMDASAALPIGTACDHADLILDDGGELLAHGPSQMQGYWKRDDLNARAFAMIGGKRYYRTGDIIRQDEGGTYHFVGRADRQVKIRGYRVELDEVELALTQHAAVSEAAVIVAEDGLTLSAFVTFSPGQTTQFDALRSHLAGLLPAYAVPQTINPVDAFARTTSGKIDRRALQEKAA